MKKGAPPKIPGLVFVQPLGSGGYADVFLYEQQSPRMPVAVKVLKSDGLTDALRQQFVEEADTMAALGDHPYIVQVFRSGTSDDGRPYLVMKYYPPPNLAMRARAERFSVEDVLRTGIQLASAVETAHRAHITHRDIKPANVLVSAYGAPGLTDFGIAGRGAREGDAPPEATDDVGVSVPWAPPEVLYGQSNGDERSDVYSLAATLWQLLVGRSPLEVPGGDNSAYALMPRIRSTAPPATGRQDVPPGLERLLAQAMAKDPAHRPSSALEFARALQAVEQQQRLGRTPIVVLDDEGHTTLVSQTQGSPTGRAADDEDRTRIKAPQTVVAQPLGPSPTAPDGETRRRPDGGAGAPRWSPAPLPGGALAASGAPVRPAATTDPVTSQTAPLGSDSSDEATVRRAASTVGAQALPAPEPVRTSPLSRPPVLWGLAAGVVVLVGLVVFLLLRPAGDGGQDAAAPPTPSATVSMPGDDSAIGDGVFDKPSVTARSGAGSVGFTWNYPQPQKKDTFRLSYGPTPSDAGNPDRSRTVSVTTPTYTVKAAKGMKVCATVRVSRSGQISPGSDVQCETAQ
ncbi:serine/threonine-protein kinase [Terrabacter aerolatus]|uniref:non-specific serine/threonine protein kinase n=1 Tax=Terrabacter aerolatus TaxID=422442 RepID=A0A512D5P8_9MICO|nr:serine/threonine-protein kinase [Terrabacter aerolatus]GEO31796.1 serine/threonine protein kinase [Terrabacter aerolatus]